MVRSTELRLLLPRHVRRFPRDLAVVIGLAVAGGLAASLPGVRGTVLRVLFGLPFALFLPGYAITAVLFPATGGAEIADSRDASAKGRTRGGPISQPHEGITLLERALFSFGLSVTVVPLVGLALNFTPWGVRFGSLVLSVGGLTVATALLATVRRWRLPADERFRIPYREWYEAARSELFEPASGVEAALNAVILLSTLVAIGSGAYAVLGPQGGQTYTEFYLLGENETGALVADDYPTTFSEGENGTFVVGIGNHERRSVEYSVIVQLQRLQEGDGTATVAESRRVEEFRVEVGANETVHRRHTVTPGASGEQLRLQYLLYLDEPPADPTAENAYRSVHLWVNVTEA